MLNFKNWLEAKIISQTRFWLSADDPSEFEMLAGVLRSEAVTQGYVLEDLDEICSGDFPQYLLSFFNANVSPGDPLTNPMAA